MGETRVHHLPIHSNATHLLHYLRYKNGGAPRHKSYFFQSENVGGYKCVGVIEYFAKSTLIVFGIEATHPFAAAVSDPYIQQTTCRRRSEKLEHIAVFCRAEASAPLLNCVGVVVQNVLDPAHPDTHIRNAVRCIKPAFRRDLSEEVDGIDIGRTETTSLVTVSDLVCYYIEKKLNASDRSDYTWRIGKVLGRGAYGAVRQIFHMRRGKDGRAVFAYKGALKVNVRHNGQSGADLRAHMKRVTEEARAVVRTHNELADLRVGVRVDMDAVFIGLGVGWDVDAFIMQKMSYSIADFVTSREFAKCGAARQEQLRQAVAQQASRCVFLAIKHNTTCGDIKAQNILVNILYHLDTPVPAQAAIEVRMTDFDAGFCYTAEDYAWKARFQPEQYLTQMVALYVSAPLMFRHECEVVRDELEKGEARYKEYLNHLAEHPPEKGYTGLTIPFYYIHLAVYNREPDVEEWDAENLFEWVRRAVEDVK